EVVDMPARLVIDDSFSEPDDAGYAEVFVQQYLELSLVEMRIAVRIEQALFGRDERALPVDVDCAAFEHERRAIAIASFYFEHLARDEIVLIPGKVEARAQAAPGVEHPIDAAHLTRIVDDERRTDISHPSIVARELYDSNRIGQHRARIDVLRTRHAHRHRLPDGDGACDRGERGLRRLSPQPPIGRSFRPQHPAAGVRFELARHSEV